MSSGRETPSENDGSDENLGEAFEALRRLAPSEAGRRANRRRVADELARRPRPAVEVRRGRPGVRSLAGLAFVLCVGFGAGWLLRGAAAPGQAVAAAPGPADARPSRLPAREPVPPPEPPLEFYARETYLCGVGRLHYGSGYAFSGE